MIGSCVRMVLWGTTGRMIYEAQRDEACLVNSPLRLRSFIFQSRAKR